MLATADVVGGRRPVLAERRPPFVVLDPVMVATSGDRLLQADAVATLRGVLLPIVEPGHAEPARGGRPARASPRRPTRSTMEAQAKALAALGPAVLVKGGHLGGAESPDLLLERGATAPVRLTTGRVATTSDHGTGCTLSSAIAALRPRHDDLAPP